MRYRFREYDAKPVSLEEIKGLFDSLSSTPSPSHFLAMLRIAHEQVRLRTRTSGAIAGGAAMMALSPIAMVLDHTPWHGWAVLTIGTGTLVYGLATIKQERLRVREIRNIMDLAVDALEHVAANLPDAAPLLEHQDHERLWVLLKATERRHPSLMKLVNSPEKEIEFPDI